MMFSSEVPLFRNSRICGDRTRQHFWQDLVFVRIAEGTGCEPASSAKLLRLVIHILAFWR